MTLSKQLVIVVLGVFLFLSAGSVWIHLDSVRNYLILQLQEQAQETANSLGLSLSPHAAADDLPVMDAMVSALFDHGRYFSIGVLDIQGNQIIERATTEHSSAAPDWFVDLVRVDPPIGTSLVMSGWRQHGKVIVQGDPGDLYANLWRSTVDTLIWFLGVGSATLLLGMLALRRFLQPLSAVEVQAAAICDGRYPVQERLPKARELRRVVNAMNVLAKRIEQQFKEQAEVAEGLRAQVYRDDVTGLGSRRDFEERIEHLFEQAENLPGTALFLLRLRDLAGHLSRHGRSSGDVLMRETGKTLRGIYSGDRPWFAARLGGGEFALVVMGMDPKEADRLTERLRSAIGELEVVGVAETQDVARIGVAMYRVGDDWANLLERADTALHRARELSHPNASYRFAESHPSDRTDRSLGGDQLMRALRAKRGRIEYQPVISADKGTEPLQTEALLRLQTTSGDMVPAGVFLPAAEALGCVTDIDRLALSQIFCDLDGATMNHTRVAANLSPSTIGDEMFLEWVHRALLEVPARGRRLAIEVHEYGLVNVLDDYRVWIERLRPLGCLFGIDHFGRGLASFGYLHTLGLDYLKLDGSFSRGIEDNLENQFVIQALLRTARQIDLRVIAEAVETEGEWAAFRRIGIDGVQGYAAGAPRNTDADPLDEMSAEA